MGNVPQALTTRLRRGAARAPPCPQLPARGRCRYGHWRTRRYGARVQPIVLVSTINDRLGDSLVGSRGTHPLPRPNPARVTKLARAGGGWWDTGPACPGCELRDDLAGGGAGSGVGVRDRDRCRRLRGTVRVAAGRRDRHGRLQRDTSMLAAHRAAIDEPAAIWLVLGYGYAWPAGLKVRRESTAIARWPDHDASVALSPPKAAATRGVLIATRTGRPP